MTSTSAKIQDTTAKPFGNYTHSLISDTFLGGRKFPVKLYFTIWRALSRNGKPKKIHTFIRRIPYERLTILECFK